MSARLPMSSGRRPSEFSQNIAGMLPTMKKTLMSASPRIDIRPEPSPNASRICGPNVYIAYIGTTWHRMSTPR